MLRDVMSKFVVLPISLEFLNGSSFVRCMSDPQCMGDNETLSLAML
jgi:hypothetical protein